MGLTAYYSGSQKPSLPAAFTQYPCGFSTNIDFPNAPVAKQKMCVWQESRQSEGIQSTTRTHAAIFAV
jgi:hypothetical protein